MYQDMIEDEVLSDTQSSASSSRRNSSISSHITTTMNTRSRRGSTTGRQSSIIDTNENKQIKQQQQQQIPVKVIVVNGKCSDVFKSTLEECVEDCILEFSGENPIYIPKGRQSIQKLNGNKQILNSNFHQSARSNRRRSSITQFNIPRSSQTNNISLPTAAITTTSVSRMRHQQLTQQKFPLVEDITEEGTTIKEPSTIFEQNSEQQQNSSEELISHPSNFDTVSQSFSPPHHKLLSASVHSSYHSREKDFRLSDLVMHGPEYYAHIFNLPRISRYSRQSKSRQQQKRTKTDEKYSELDRIKQDLFHRYLWTQKPQVSCRIRPMSTYTRSTTFVL